MKKDVSEILRDLLTEALQEIAGERGKTLDEELIVEIERPLSLIHI